MTDTAPHIPAPASPLKPQHAATTGPRKAEQPYPLRRAVTARISSLQEDYRKDSPRAVQDLARLRRGIGRQANETPDLWGLLGIEQFYAAQPQDRSLSEAEALRAESAAHVAVTLWALHQQSNRTKAMHVADGASLGAAVRRLMAGTDSDEPIRKRLLRAGTATTFDVLSHRLRELVVLLRKAEIPLDYGLLADHLEQWQKPGGPTQVRQAWGRGFHAYRLPTDAARPRNSTPEAPDTHANAGCNDTKDQT
ncbi:type I-E CRISPR-associated protein Cse2/CasB [Streptomyces sp. NPDC001591]|uniref:type I-E CRISPR-associated protein Cse2/CasB n=1 Tax=Streptomyces sp. NPDC001591 TaxID=3364589 RepID=UPI0036BC345C